MSAPTDVCLCVTSACNLNCKHCFAKSSHSKRDLSAGDIFRIIRELSAEKVFFVTLFGGEPFIRNDIIDIIEYLSSFRIGISVNTNATLIDDDLARTLKRFRMSYAVSLDGSSADIVDKIRGRGVYDRTLSGIHALKKHARDVLISATVMSHNYNDLFRIAALCKELGVVGVRFNNVFYINNAECYLDDIFLSPDQNRELFSIYEELRDQYGSFVSGSLFQQMDLIKHIHEDKTLPAGDESIIEVQPCGAAINKCAIKPDGEVTPCVILWNTPAGNLLQKPLKEIWDNSDVLNEFRSVFYLTENEIGECIRCRYKHICYTGHRCIPYHCHGGIKNKSLFCIKTWMP